MTFENHLWVHRCLHDVKSCILELVSLCEIWQSDIIIIKLIGIAIDLTKGSTVRGYNRLVTPNDWIIGHIYKYAKKFVSHKYHVLSCFMSKRFSLISSFLVWFSGIAINGGEWFHVPGPSLMLKYCMVAPGNGKPQQIIQQ